MPSAPTPPSPGLPCPKSKEHHQSHPLCSLPTCLRSLPLELPSRPSFVPLAAGLSARYHLRYPSSSATPSRPAGPPSTQRRELPQPLDVFLSLHYARRSLIIELDPPLHRSRRRLATTCKFLVTPVPMSLRLFSPRGHLPVLATPPRLRGLAHRTRPHPVPYSVSPSSAQRHALSSASSASPWSRVPPVPLCWIAVPVCTRATLRNHLACSLFPRQAPLSTCAIVALGGFSSSSVH